MSRVSIRLEIRDEATQLHCEVRRVLSREQIDSVNNGVINAWDEILEAIKHEAESYDYDKLFLSGKTPKDPDHWGDDGNARMEKMKGDTLICL